MKQIYTFNKIPIFAFTAISIFAFLLVATSQPFEYKPDVIFFFGFFIFLILFGFFDFMYGTYVTLEDNSLSRTDYFFLKKRISLGDVVTIRYQPTYGIGKEASSLYIFRKEHAVASITMTSLWFTERVLRDFLRDIKKQHPAISLDEEARELMERTDGYFDSQKIQAVPFSLGILGVIGGILLFIKVQSSTTEEFNLINHGLASMSAGLIAGFGTYTLLRRHGISILVGCVSFLVLFGVYWIAAGN